MGVWAPFPLSMDHRWKDALNNLHETVSAGITRNPGNPGILGILGILGFSISRRSRHRHVSAAPSRCSLRASLRIRAPCTSQASSLASTSSLDTAEFVEVSERQPQHDVHAFGVARLALEVPQHQILDVRAHLLLPDAPILHDYRALTVEVSGMRARECIVGARVGGRRGGTPASRRCAQSLACFLSSGMLIGDEEAASHWAHDRLLGAWMCPASWPFWMHDARSPCLLGNVPLRALRSDRRSPAVWGHRTPAGGEAVEGAARPVRRQ